MSIIQLFDNPKINSLIISNFPSLLLFIVILTNLIVHRFKEWHEKAEDISGFLFTAACFLGPVFALFSEQFVFILLIHFLMFVVLCVCLNWLEKDPSAGAVFPTMIFFNIIASFVAIMLKGIAWLFSFLKAGLSSFLYF